MRAEKQNKFINKRNFEPQDLIVVFAILLFSVNILAQKPRPKDSSQKEIPVVVSRDSDSVRRTMTGEDVKESSKSEATKSSILTKKSTDSKTVKQKKMMLYLDLLTRTEQRAASLQKQLIELIEKQNSLSAKISKLEYQMRPEVISASLRLTGSLRPEDLREQRRKTLEIEKSNSEALIQRLNARRNNLENSVLKADALVEKIRARFDKIIDEALNEEDELF